MPEFYIILARKIIKIPNFFIFARKINKIPEFYMIFPRKMPEFYIIAQKIFFPEFWGTRAPSPRLLRLCSVSNSYYINCQAV